tara:strand:+ start:675 stop:1127 length:453 start_codon:yes stop_codon:yes gene_type:complete
MINKLKIHHMEDINNDNNNNNNNDNNYDNNYNYTDDEFINDTGNFIFFNILLIGTLFISMYVCISKLCNMFPVTRSLNNQPLITTSSDPVILIKKKYENTGDMDECPVCLEKYNEYEELIELDCNHYYHEKCIKDWLKNNRNCPMCREGV